MNDLILLLVFFSIGVFLTFVFAKRTLKEKTGVFTILGILLAFCILLFSFITIHKGILKIIGMAEIQNWTRAIIVLFSMILAYHFMQFTAKISQEYVIIHLLKKWSRETVYLSSSTQMAEHPISEELLKMAATQKELVIFVLFKHIEKYPHICFYLLAKILNANPVSTEHSGNIPAMIKDWQEWGKQKNLIKV